MKQPGSRQWFWRVAQLVFLAVVGYFMYRRFAPELRGLQWSELARYSPSVPTLLVSLLLVIAMYVMHALLWRHVAQQLGGSRLATRETLYVYFVSGLGRYLPGKLWQIAGMAVMAQRAGLQPVIATAAALVAQLAFITAGVLLLAILLPTQYGRAALVSALLLILVGLGLYLLGNTVRGRELRHRLLHRFGTRISEAGALLDRINGRQALSWTAAYGFSWVLLGLGFTLFVNAFGAAEHWNVLFLIGTAAASYVIGYLVLTPAGIGGREAAMFMLLQTIMRPEAALLIAAASRIWFTVGELAPLAAIPLLPRARPASAL
jgi:glycosyltransferase 2 family protein